MYIYIYIYVDVHVYIYIYILYTHICVLTEVASGREAARALLPNRPGDWRGNISLSLSLYIYI